MQIRHTRDCNFSLKSLLEKVPPKKKFSAGELAARSMPDSVTCFWKKII
jgi:hypothetical protein